MTSRYFPSLLLAAVLLITLNLQQPLAAPVYDHAESRTMPMSADTRDSRQSVRLAGTPKPRNIRMEAVSAEKIAEEKATGEKPGVPRKIGVGRTVHELETPKGVARQLEWQTLPSGGKLAAISISSPNAVGIRLGIRVTKIPAGTLFRFYSQGSVTAINVPAEEILSLLAHNSKAGDKSENGKTYWGPYIAGEEATVEIQLPPGSPETSLEISIPQVSHFFADPLSQDSPAKKNKSIGDSDSCELDATCYGGWLPQANSTAKMSFVEAGYSWLCTGTLVSDTQGSLTPYFLSANHCISTQTVASTLQTFWFYRSSTCGNATLNPNYRTLTGGAQLLYQNFDTDTSFMKLLGTPPGGAKFSGWLASPPSVSESVVGIHHPEGDLQKISFGGMQSFMTCTSDM